MWKEYLCSIPNPICYIHNVCVIRIPIPLVIMHHPRYYVKYGYQENFGNYSLTLPLSYLDKTEQITSQCSI